MISLEKLMVRPRKDSVLVRLNDAEAAIVWEAMRRFGEVEKAPAIRKVLLEWKVMHEMLSRMAPVIERGVTAMEGERR